MSLQGTVCVKFSPKQYMKLYECGLLYAHNKPLSSNKAVLTSVESVLKTWIFAGSYKDAITIPPKTLPCLHVNN